MLAVSPGVEMVLLVVVRHPGLRDGVIILHLVHDELHGRVLHGVALQATGRSRGTRSAVGGLVQVADGIQGVTSEKVRM